MFGLFALVITLETLSVPPPQTYQTVQFIEPVVQAYTPVTSAQNTSTTVNNSSQNVTPTTTSLPSTLPSSSYQSPEALLEELQNTSSPGTATLVEAVRPMLAPQFSPLTFDRVLQSTYVPIQSTTNTGTALLSGSLATNRSQECATDGGPFQKNLSLGDLGEEVRAVQQFLNRMPETQLAETGAGSQGNETDIFAQKTFDSVKKFQELYRADILAPLTLAVPSGIWGPSTRAKANALYCSTGRP